MRLAEQLANSVYLEPGDSAGLFAQCGVGLAEQLANSVYLELGDSAGLSAQCGVGLAEQLANSVYLEPGDSAGYRIRTRSHSLHSHLFLEDAL